MLRFHLESCSENTVAHKVRRYIYLFVAPELISDVLGCILAKTHTASTNKKLICHRQVFALVPPGSFGLSKRWCL